MILFSNIPTKILFIRVHLNVTNNSLKKKKKNFSSRAPIFKLTERKRALLSLLLGSLRVLAEKKQKKNFEERKRVTRGTCRYKGLQIIFRPFFFKKQADWSWGNRAFIYQNHLNFFRIAVFTKKKLCKKLRAILVRFVWRKTVDLFCKIRMELPCFVSVFFFRKVRFSNRTKTTQTFYAPFSCKKTDEKV